MSPSPSRHHHLLPWLIWGLGASFYSFAFFQRVAPSAMTAELMRDFAAGAAALGNLSAVYFYVYGGLQIPVGVVLDRWGTRWLLMGAAALGAIGSVLFGLAPNLDVAFAGRVLIGASASVAYLGCLKLAVVWFAPSRFALLAGLIIPFGMVGAILGQAPLGALVEEVGWRAPMLGASAFAALILFLLWTTRLAAPHRPTGAPPERAPNLRRLGWSLGQAARTSQTWIIALAVSTMNAPILAFAGLWGVPYLVQVYGLERTLAGAGTSIMLLGWAFGAPLSGWLSERLRRRKAVFVAGAAIALAGWLAMTLGGPLPLAALYLLFALIGVGSGVAILAFVFARERVGAEISGSVSAVINTTIMAVAALCQYLMGLFLDLGWDGTMLNGARIYSPDAYGAALWLLPGATAISFAVALALHETHPSRAVRPLPAPPA